MMRAARIHRYGAADEFRIEEVEPMLLGPEDLRISVHASSVNPVDFKIRSGGQRAIIPLTFPATLGMDVSGVVTEVGAAVSDFVVGDEVFSSPSHRRMGSYAEEIVVRSSEVAKKPASLSHEEAASLPLVGLTAWDALVESCRVGPGDRVLIQAGAGGVGTVAIQLAKQLGAEVLTTCSARNVPFVTELGADVAIDYRTQDYVEVAQGCDAVVESIGGEHVGRALRTVRRGGRIASLTQGLPSYTKRYGAWPGLLVFGVRTLGVLLHAWLVKGRKLMLVTRKPRGENLRKLAALVDEGAIRPVIDRVFPLADVAEAHRYLETGRAQGKVVLAVR
ncbi:MAG: NADP-dependent oxidoreductase [Myxococcota bacterium]